MPCENVRSTVNFARNAHDILLSKYANVYVKGRAGISGLQNPGLYFLKETARMEFCEMCKKGVLSQLETRIKLVCDADKLYRNSNWNSNIFDRPTTEFLACLKLSAQFSSLT